jgi:signal transduction histidine kinase
MRATIGRQAQQLTRPVDDLLDLSRINRGHIEVRGRRFELRALLEAAVDAAHPLSASTLIR